MANNVKRALNHAKERGVIISIRHPVGEAVTVFAACSINDKHASKSITADNFDKNGEAAMVLAIENAMEEALHNG